jgi:hypothetical protein
MMKKVVGIIVAGVFILALGMGFSHIPMMGSGSAYSCGWGSSSSGGGDYVPQRRGSIGPANAPSLTKDQARDVLSNHVKSLNPDLKIGPVTDGGGFYEADILARSGSVVEHLAVDKISGGIVRLN